MRYNEQLRFLKLKENTCTFEMSTNPINNAEEPGFQLQKR